VSSTMKDRATRTSAVRQALVDRMAELKPALDRKMRVRLPDDLRADLQSVTIHQLEALGLLERGGLRMSELARELDISEPASTALADRLVRGGLAERHADPDDRRIVRLELSPKGRDLMSRWASHRRRMMNATFEVLSDRQLAALIDILETLAADAPAADAATGKERTA
jgi:MarR family transcriptional regulator, organic hydroperoxide resistance regulator